MKQEIAEQAIIDTIVAHLGNDVKVTRLMVEKLLRDRGLTDKRLAKELAEFAIVLHIRNIISNNRDYPTPADKYNKIVEEYDKQLNLSFRNSTSIKFQQYSTPAPIAYVAGLFCQMNRGQGLSVLEPSAGNGFMTLAATTPNTLVVTNEIDPMRRNNLIRDSYIDAVHGLDTSEPYPPRWNRRFDAVITNPPFGKMGKAVAFGPARISELDHVMAIRALEAMKDDGRAAIIIGGHTDFDDKGRIKKGKNRTFFQYLYHFYHVAGVIQIDGKKLYRRMGTGFPTRLILIAGRKATPGGSAPTRNENHQLVTDRFDDLWHRVNEAADYATRIKLGKPNTIDLTSAKSRLAAIRNMKGTHLGELGAPYKPVSNACFVLDTQVPDGMEQETKDAQARILEAIGGDFDEFVRVRMGYPNHPSLCNAFAAEQIDAIAMAIYNIEARGQGSIIGDQTGIGKGRAAASIIRYAVKRGLKPVFITEKPNLFSDIYRDLKAIGSSHLRPLFINSREGKSNIKDEAGNIIYQAPHPQELKSILESQKIPSNYHFVIATYTQFNDPEKRPLKPNFLRKISKGNILIMDESHNASGSGNTGIYFRDVLGSTLGVAYLSATSMKRADNIPLYAKRTALADASMDSETLIEAIGRGGVALQEVISSQLVAEGQMIRRERSFKDVKVNWINLSTHSAAHRATANNITEILRDIIKFQKNYVTPIVSELDDIAAEEQGEVELRAGTDKAGVDSLPYFSKVFNVINQMLFAIKAEAVADRAIMRLKEGKKPVIAFSSTMAAFLEQMENERGDLVKEGDTIKADFAIVLQKGLDGVLRYTTSDGFGKQDFLTFSLAELGMEATLEYNRIRDKIHTISTGIFLSPIDVIVQKIEAAGYSVAEVTGRKMKLQLNPGTGVGLVLNRKRINVNDAFRQFNDNEVDVLMINQSGSTGASAHAVATDKVPADQVKQRVMIILQAELNINTEVQKRGRIMRTGQLMLPEYDYMASDIPAEGRLMMMLQKKLKSLDANTSSNQKQSTSVLDVPDFLNKIGNKVVKEWIKENPKIDEELDYPLRGAAKGSGGAAAKVSGRVAVLSTEDQERFYNEVTRMYDDEVSYLKQVGEYDLEVEALDLKAKVLERKIVIAGKGTGSPFGTDSELVKMEVNNLRKPFTADELKNLIQDASKGDPKQQQEELLKAIKDYTGRRTIEEQMVIDERFARLREEQQMDDPQKGQTDDPEKMLLKQKERADKLEEARQKSLNNSLTKWANKNKILASYVNFFYAGKKLVYKIFDFNAGSILQMGVFIGYHIDTTKKNAYEPSNIHLKFAIAGSTRLLKIPASKSEVLDSIKSASTDETTPSMERLLLDWTTAREQYSADRTVRYIIQGNLLQAFGQFSGRLINFTTEDGRNEKGILLPEHYSPIESEDTHVTVPIIQALPHLKSLQVGSTVSAGKVGISRTNDGYGITVPASRKKGGDVYLDEELLALVDNGEFAKRSDVMYATLPFDKISSVTEVLGKNLNLTISLSRAIFDTAIKKVTTSGKRVFEKLDLIPSWIKKKAGGISNIVKAKAKILFLKLKLEKELKEKQLALAMTTQNPV